MRRGPAGILVRCARCGGDLEGDATDAMLLDPGCALGREPRPGGLIVPLRFLAAPGSAAARTGAPAVPFYGFPGLDPGARALGPEGKAGVARVSSIRTGWVLAARIRRFQEYGDAGLEYMRRPPRLEKGSPRRALGVARSLADAETVLKVMLWRVAAEVSPAGSFAIEPRPGPPEIWCVSPVADGDLIKLPHCPIRYPVGLIEGFRDG